MSTRHYRHGLFVGKFYPFHLGHLKVIQDARVLCDVVTVVVIDSAAFSQPPAVVRENWIRASLREGAQTIADYAAIQVVIMPDLPGIDDSLTWALHTRHYVTQPIDVVFSSEWYGVAYATALGAEHVMVDFARTNVPISGTKIRENPMAHMSYLPPIVRAHFVKRVVVVGAESTGKTTLTQALAKHYEASYVHEYGRIYAEGKLYDHYESWTSDEFAHIAIMQCMLEDQLARRSNKVLLCDTDAFATSVWHYRYMGFDSPIVTTLAMQRKADLTILAGDDIPFFQDGTRDGEHIRHEMQQWFRDRLRTMQRSFIEVWGPPEVRLEAAVSAIDRLLERTA